VSASGADQAVAWQHGVLRILHPLPADTSPGPLRLNERGEIVGFSEGSVRDVRRRFVQGAVHAVMWTAERQPVALPDMPGDSTSVARGINSRGDIVAPVRPTPSSGVHTAKLFMRPAAGAFVKRTD
jgi:uncharacterized membrane protein